MFFSNFSGLLENSGGRTRRPKKQPRPVTDEVEERFRKRWGYTATSQTLSSRLSAGSWRSTAQLQTYQNGEGELTSCAKRGPESVNRKSTNCTWLPHEPKRSSVCTLLQVMPKQTGRQNGFWSDLKLNVQPAKHCVTLCAEKLTQHITLDTQLPPIIKTWWQIHHYLGWGRLLLSADREMSRVDNRTDGATAETAKHSRLV